MPNNDLAGARIMFGLLLAPVLLSAAPCQAAPLLQLSRTAIQFGPMGYGTLSSVEPVFVTNTGDAAKS